jgi:hemerythrin
MTGGLSEGRTVIASTHVAPPFGHRILFNGDQRMNAKTARLSVISASALAANADAAGPETSAKRSPFVVEWRDGFKVNIPQADREHKHLFQLVKRLDLTTVQETVDELLDYVVLHFTNEQQLMEDSNYPAFAAHLKLHEEFGATVADFLGSGDVWTEDRVQELRRFLNKWLIGHIMTHDLRFGNWYRKHHGADAPEVVAKPEKKAGWLKRLFNMS